MLKVGQVSLWIGGLLLLYPSMVFNEIFPFQNYTLDWEVRLDDLISRLTVDELLIQVNTGGPYGQYNGPSPAIPRLGIPPFQWNSECLRGYVDAGPATSFPQALGLAATFDAELLRAVGEAGAIEARAHHADATAKKIYLDHTGIVCFSPVVNLMVHSLWGRNQEAYGEDPYLTGRLAQHFVRGLQGEHPRYLRTVSTCKHFLAHTGPENLPVSRFQFDARVSEVDMRNSFMPHFEACIRGDGSGWTAPAFGVMCSYNSINGVPACVSPYVPLAYTEWSFRGMMISDDGALESIVNDHKYLSNYEDAAVEAFTLGVNLELDLNTQTAVYSHLKQALDKGRITQELLVQRARDLFRLRMLLGEFDPPEMVPFNYTLSDVVQSPRHRNLSLQAAMRSLVLLKNADDFLPLEASHLPLASLTLVGPFATEMENIYGDYAPSRDPNYTITLAKGLAHLLRDGSQMRVALGCQDGPVCKQYDSASVLAAIKTEQTLIVVALGAGQINEEEGIDRPSFDLPNSQQQLFVDLLSHAPKKVPIVLLLFSASPINVRIADRDPRVRAIFQCTYPAQYTGSAVYSVLTMSAGISSNPAARLPYTWYGLSRSVPFNADYDMTNKTYRYVTDAQRATDVLYPFGYGLSYTRFHYASLRAPPVLWMPTLNDNFTISFTLASLGPYDGDEVVQVYIVWPTSAYASLTHVPRVQLVHFTRVSLGAYASTRVSLAVALHTFRLWDVSSHSYVFPAGTYTLFVGGQQPNVQSSGHSVPSNVLSAQMQIVKRSNLL